MPFRARLKKTFSRSSSDGSSTLSQIAPNSSSKDSNVYQPGEKMPPMKYRRPVAKEHKEHLEAFNFSKAWRRRSHQSVYSPMGSRMPSRAGSVITSGPSRNGSVVTAGRKSFAVEPTEETSEEGTDSANGEAETESDESSPTSSVTASSAASTVEMESWSFPRR